MAKRSGTSKGGGSKTKNKSEYYGNSEYSGHVHEYEYEYEASDSQKAEWVKEVMPDATYKEISSIIAVMDSWSGSMYSSIRDAQTAALEGKSYRESAFKAGEILENYIKAAPKYKGQIYRGVNLDDSAYNEIMNTLSNGGTINMKGTASWSSSLKTAQSFASTYSGRHKVVFVLNGDTKAGTSIQHLSSYGKGEHEVLVSKKTRYSATKIETDKAGRTVIYVNESLVD